MEPESGHQAAEPQIGGIAMCGWVGEEFRTNKEMIQDIKIKEMAQNPNQMAGLWATAANSPLPAQDLHPSVTKDGLSPPHLH